MWLNAIGEDIVLTWNLLNKGWITYFEPLAVAFTDVPTNLYSISSQRSRWSRGMIEALKRIKPLDLHFKHKTIHLLIYLL
ncbi:glycosyltransferase family 2 protein [Clostridium algoriphilum]|uniref:glycosyltransferase n=1 Tax=Clostridium algoriphilum TaxID=198347 RepID=UPI001CF19858|nr:glycosyltransferase family 2 protein [Clostridium algoriphilum]MCB2295996.1 glycosyltransferase family 2 protein [Clostridium algoriphilum]